MSWMDAISDIVSRYSGAGGGTAAAPADPHQDFQNVAQNAPPQVTADALSHAFRSDQTPSFPDMVAKLFHGSNPDQRAGLLNHLLGNISPAALASIPGLGQLAGMFGGGQKISPEQADQVSPGQVQQAMEHAQNTNPAIVDQVSSFYAAHPMAIKALGASAVTFMLQHIARRTP